MDRPVGTPFGNTTASTTGSVGRPNKVGESPDMAFRSMAAQLRGLKLAGVSIDKPLTKAQALNGKADIEGPRAQDVANALNYLYARSRKFRSWIDEDDTDDDDQQEHYPGGRLRRIRRRKKGKRYMVRTTFGDTNSFASISPEETSHETVLLNLSQIKGTKYGVVGLVAHEFGHAAGGYKDGKPGQIGPNQIAEAEVLAQAGIGDGGVLVYGQDLGGQGIKPVYYIMMG